MAHTTDQLNAALAGRYTIDRKLGEGGMATVYLARDARHSRRVAVKVLKPDLAAIVGVDRFLSEITVTANLQHPNLLPLFDSGEADGLLFYVMPYVEGETLRGRLEREKQLPVDDAVSIGVAVASALDYAHRHGVIHRDLKPENILLHEGQPVVADFGIALAVSNAGAGRITQTGLSLGTPQYMSPEQATGDRQIDARTDIYALGAVLYEMLTGDPPHTASTAQAVIARVLTERPRAIRITRPSVPEHVAAAVEHALEKLPADRFSTAQEMSDALLGRSRVDLPVHASVAENRRRTSAILRAAPWAGTAVFAAIAAWSMFKPAPPPKVGIVEIPLPPGAMTGTLGRAIAISPDGSRIIVVSNRDGVAHLYQRRLDELTLHAIAGADGLISPTFSPDGQWLLGSRRSDRRLYKLPVTGGGLIPVADSAANGSWGDHGSIVFLRGGDLWRVSDAGGVPARVTSVAAAKLPVRFLSLAEVLPGEGYAVVTAVRSDGQRELARVALSNGKIDLLGVLGSNPRYSAGYLLFADVNSTLLAARFSPRNATFQSAPTPLRTGVITYANGTSQFAVSAEGTLVGLFGEPPGTDDKDVARVVGARQLVDVDANGSSRPLFNERRYYGWSHISPDGNRVAMEIGEAPGGPWDVWVLDIRSATLTRLTTNGTGIRPAGWTSDGRKVVFLQRPPGMPVAGVGGVAAGAKVVAMPWDRSAPPDTLFTHEISEGASIGPAHSYLAVAVGPNPGANDLWIAPLDTLRVARPFVASPANETTPAVSPNGKLLAYTSDESGRVEVYVVPLAGPRGRILVSTGGGTEPVWDRVTGNLYYRGAQRLMHATISTAPELRVVKRDSLFEDKYWRGTYSYDVFPDGKHFLMIQGDDASAQATLILNWPSLLNRAPPR